VNKLNEIWHGVLFIIAATPHSPRAKVKHVMNSKLFASLLMILLKYFFDIEKEITHSILLAGEARLIMLKHMLPTAYKFSFSGLLKNTPLLSWPTTKQDHQAIFQA
jgi:hypothetical protein